MKQAIVVEVWEYLDVVIEYSRFHAFNKWLKDNDYRMLSASDSRAVVLGGGKALRVQAKRFVSRHDEVVILEDA